MTTVKEVQLKKNGVPITPLTIVDSIVNADGTKYKDSVDKKLNGKSNTDHLHDDRYFIKSNTTISSNYFIFDNNLKIQWGSVTLGTDHVGGTSTFPLAFNDTPIIATSFSYSGGSWDYQEASISSLSNTHVTFVGSDTYGGKVVRWIAIGF